MFANVFFGLLAQRSGPITSLPQQRIDQRNFTDIRTGFPKPFFHPNKWILAKYLSKNKTLID